MDYCYCFFFKKTLKISVFALKTQPSNQGAVSYETKQKQIKKHKSQMGHNILICLINHINAI